MKHIPSEEEQLDRFDNLVVTVDSFEPSNGSDEESNGSDNDIDGEEPSSCIKDSDCYAAK